MDWKKEMRETVFYILIGLILAFTINTSLGYALNTQRPVMAVVSGSMEPTFYKGDLIVAKGVPTESLVVGDVIVFENHLRGIDVVHRVIKVEGGSSHTYFYTQGDNNRTNPISDQESGLSPPVMDDWVKGKVVLVIPKLGWFKVILTEFLGLLP